MAVRKSHEPLHVHALSAAIGKFSPRRYPATSSADFGCASGILRMSPPRARNSVTNVSHSCRVPISSAPRQSSLALYAIAGTNPRQRAALICVPMPKRLERDMVAPKLCRNGSAGPFRVKEQSFPAVCGNVCFFQERTFIAAAGASETANDSPGLAPVAGAALPIETSSWVSLQISKAEQPLLESIFLPVAKAASSESMWRVRVPSLHPLGPQKLRR